MKVHGKRGVQGATWRSFGCNQFDALPCQPQSRSNPHHPASFTTTLTPVQGAEVGFLAGAVLGTELLGRGKRALRRDPQLFPG